MSLTRREAIGVLVGTGLVIGGCQGKSPLTKANSLADDDARFLNRVGFGSRPGDIERYKELGREAWLEFQLSPTSNEPLDLAIKIGKLPASNLLAWELRDWPKRDVIRQAQQTDLLYAAYSPWQVRERMVDFWTNHFNIYCNKGLAAYRIPTDQREVVRKHALGSFPEMLKASAKSTAMLLYLDQQASHYGQPNENYARELLELHTLGVDGGYTQRDVMEVARCFTGWTEERRSFLKIVREDGGLGPPRGSFRFDNALHDTGAKTVLGQTIPSGGGVEDGERVIEIVANHPSTAKHIARKLCAYFLGVDGKSLEDRVATAYLEQPIGDIPNLLRTIFLSDQFLKGSPTFKRPFDFVVSALRVVDASTDGNTPILRHLELMGQPTHMWPMPDGYPMHVEAWNGSVLGRWNFAIQLCNNQIKGTKVDIEKSDFKHHSELVDVILRGSLRPIYNLVETSNKLSNTAALCLSSPEFQWK